MNPECQSCLVKELCPFAQKKKKASKEVTKGKSSVEAKFDELDVKVGMKTRGAMAKKLINLEYSSEESHELDDDEECSVR